MKKILLIVEHVNEASIKQIIESIKSISKNPVEIVITDVKEKTRDLSEFDAVIIENDRRHEPMKQIKIKAPETLPELRFPEKPKHKGHERPYKYHP